MSQLKEEINNLKEDMIKDFNRELEEGKYQLLMHIKKAMAESLILKEDICTFVVNSYEKDEVIDAIIDYLKEENYFAYKEEEKYYDSYYGATMCNRSIIINVAENYNTAKTMYEHEKEMKEISKSNKYFFIKVLICCICIYLLIKFFI